MKNDTPTPLVFVVFTIIGVCLGMAVNIVAKPPTPTPADCQCELNADRVMVLGLSELAVDLHEGLNKAEAERDRIRKEATIIVNGMMQEIQRLQKRPSVNPSDKMANN